jgi:hypothetical protein
MLKILSLNMTTTDGYTEPFHIGRTNKLATDAILASGKSWGSAVVDLEWSLHRGFDEEGRSLEQWNAFSPAVQMSSSATSLRRVPVGGLSYIRLKTSTADPANADAGAIAVFQLL